LAWEPIAYGGDGGYYEIGYATAAGGPYAVHGTTEDSGQKAATGYVAAGLQPGTAYYFAVRTYTPAHDWQQNDLWSESTAEISGTTAACFPPAVPTLTLPGDGSHTADSTPAFEWETATGADDYELEVAGDPGFASPAIVTATAATVVTPLLSLADDTYFWHVRGHNASAGCDTYGDWSDVWTVTVDTIEPLGAISINDGDAYSRDVTVTLTLTATDSVGVTEMNLQANGAWGGWEPFAPTKEGTLAGGDGIHTVYVRYRDAAGNHSAVVEDSIELDTVPPTVPSLLSPADGTVTEQRAPTFDWTASVGAAGYQLQLDDDEAFDSPELDRIQTNTSHVPGSLLPAGVHFWRVRARDAAGNWSSWTSAWELEIETGGNFSLFLPLILNQEKGNWSQLH
jgi:hypothetical protein